MVDWVKKVNKSRKGDFAADEQLIGATFVQPGGNFGSMMGSQLGGVVGAFAASKMSSDEPMDLDTSHGFAAEIAGQNAVLGVTNKRLLVWNHSSLSGKPKDLKAELPISHVAGVAFEPGKLVTKIALRFADGSGVGYEAPKIGKPDDFVGVLAETTG